MPIRSDDEELTIAVDGQKIGGWEEVHVVRGVERLPSAFYIQTTDRFPGQISQFMPKVGSVCRIYLTGDKILTGYIDSFDIRITATSHTILLSGRSKTEDLVDSAVFGNDKDIGGWQLDVKTIGEAAKKLCKPHGIEVSLPDGDFDIPKPNIFPINPGVTGAQLLGEMARTTGSLVWDDPEGRLVISAVGTKRTNTALVEGANIETVRTQRRMDIRFSDYYVFGQGYQVGSGWVPTFAHVEDPDVKALGRKRVRIIPWESPDQNDNEYSKKRALWEAARRMGRGNLITIGVTGWRDGEGKIWTPNSVVSINAPNAKVKRELVISEVTWERTGAGGTTASLTCMPPEGLKPEPLVREQPVVGTTEAAPTPTR